MNTKDKCEATNQSRPAEPLADLELTAEQAEETKAGDGTRSFSPFQGFRGGVFVATGDID